jgi:hypothetical protein
MLGGGGDGDGWRGDGWRGGERWQDPGWSDGRETAIGDGQRMYGPRPGSQRRRRQVVAAVVIVAVLAVGYVRLHPGGVVNAGRALGVLTGDVATLPGVEDPAAVGAPGEGQGPRGAGGTEAAVGGPDDTVVAPGPDGVVGSDDDVVISTGAARGSSPGSVSSTTDTTRSASSTSTTLPPIPVDLAVSRVEVPATAEDSTDGCGKNVDFDGPLVADHQPETTWRMDGDGTGQSLTLTLDGPHHIVSVGMIPGYALVDGCDGTNRFTQNRRITRATWQFDDGTTVTQDLRDAAEMQMVAVSAQATTVTIRIEGVTGEPERDFTAISEVDVRGT